MGKVLSVRQQHSKGQAVNKAKKLTGRTVALWISGFFLVVFTVNGIMTYLAFHSWGGLETQDAYRKGLDYNREIEAARAQKTSGWKISLASDPGQMQGHINVMITRPEGSTDPVLIQASISRPATDKYDQTIPLLPQPDGLFTAPYVLPLPGQWDIVILVKTEEDGTAYTLNRRFFIPEPSPEP